MSKELKITIDGHELTATEGQYIIEVASENGIHIPSLCYHPRLRSTGACRVCVVEVEGGRALMPACATPVERDGTVVHTRNERVLAARKLSVELLLASGNHDCPNCSSNGQCELQDLAYELEIEHPRFPIQSPEYPFDHSNPMIVRDLNKCVLCGRCVRGCQEVQVNQVIQFGFRGPDTKIVTGGDTDYTDSTCVFCGECIQLCPVGAISEKQRMPYGKAFEEETVRSVCTYCGTGHDDGLAETRALVHVLCPEDPPHELHEQVILFVRAACRREPCQGLRAVLLLDLPETGGHESQRLVPARLPKGFPLPDQG